MNPRDTHLRGEFAAHPRAAEFAAVVRRVHFRYANEVVLAFGLCPFLSDAESGFGHFCVVLDRAPNPELACAAALGVGAGVVHLVFPLVETLPQKFERFAAEVGARVREAVKPSPVLAAFHPMLGGDASRPAKLVGLLRRAPDPFVQFVPAGLHEGGTVFAGAMVEPGPDRAQLNFDRLQGSALEELLEILRDIHEDRKRSYAPFLAAFTKDG